MPFHCRFVTPERVLVEADLASLSLPTETGEITVLPGHEPLTTVLVPGVAQIVEAGKPAADVAVSGGFAQIERGGRVTVLAESVETGEDLDLGVIAEAKARAERVMKDAAGKDDLAFAAAAAALRRELARERLAVRYKLRGRIQADGNR